MSLDLGTMGAVVTLDNSDYKRNLRDIEQSSGNAFQKIATYAATYLSARALFGTITKSTNAFSELEETSSKFDVVFSKVAFSAEESAKNLEKFYGQSELTAKRMLSGTGDLFTGFDFAQDIALDLADGVAKLGSDLASFSNYAGGAEGASYALTKAMLDEAEQAKMLGVVIRQEDEQTKKLAEQAMTTGVTIDALGKTFRANSKTQARAIAALATAYMQSKNALGDFMRTSDSYANKSRTLDNSIQAFSANMGARFVPAITEGKNALNNLLGDWNALDKGGQDAILTIGAMCAGLLLMRTEVMKTANAKIIGIANLGNNQIAKLEAEQAIASENVKRAEYARSDAVREALAKRQEVRIARLAQAEARADMIGAKIKLSTGGLDNAGELQAKKQLEQASLRLTQAQLKESQATQALNANRQLAKTSTMQHTVATNAQSVASNNLARAQTAGGRAGLFLTNGLKSAALSLKAFFVSMGPIGWAMMAFAGVKFIMNRLNAETEKAIQLAKEHAEEIQKAAKASDDDNKKKLSLLPRLQELSTYEKLSSNEQQEAQKILDLLGLSYEKYGVHIDKTTGKLVFEKKSLAELIEMRKEQAKQERIDFLKKQINANESKKEKISTGYGRAFADSAATNWSGWGGLYIGKLFDSNKEVQDKIDKNNKDINNENEKLRQELSGLQKGTAEYGTDNAPDTAKTINEADRRTKQSLDDYKWKVKFDNSTLDKQLTMLDDKQKALQDKLFETAGNKNQDDYTAKELEMQKEILEIEQEKAKIKKQSAEEFKREQESYQDYLTKQQKDEVRKNLDRDIRQKEKDGDTTGAISIIEQQYSQAQEVAKNLRRKYEQAFEEAQADGIMTEAEREALSKSRRQMEEALSDETHWRDRFTDYDKKDENNQKGLVAYSSELLNAQLGKNQNKPAVETAKNTKQQLEIMRTLVDYIETIAKNNEDEIIGE